MTRTTRQRRAARIRAEWAEEREQMRTAGSEFVRGLCRKAMRFYAVQRLSMWGHNREGAR